MSFCQACGAKNADDARFCNACGARIVQGQPAGAATPSAAAAPPSAATGPIAGDAGKDDVWAMASQRGLPSPGGTGAATATHPGFSNQTLSGVGIPSRRSTLGTLAAVALTCLALGALLAWLVMRPGEAPADGAGTAGADEGSGEARDTLPPGVDEPDDPSFEEGRAGRGGGRGGAGAPTERGATGGSGASGGGPEGSGDGAGSGEPRAAGGSATSAGGARGAGAGSAAGSGSASAGGTGGTSTSTSTSGSAGGAAASAGGTGAGGTGGTPAGGAASGGASGGAGATGDRAAMDEAGGETSYETTLYVNNVRRYIQNHYARQATSCFGRASAESGAAVGGRVVIGFTISASGATEGVHVVRNDSGVEALGACLVNRVDSWEMPAPPRGEPVELALPFSS